MGGATLSSPAVQLQGTDGATANLLTRLHTRSNHSDRGMLDAMRGIGSMCESLGLVDNVKTRALATYKEVGTCSSII
jgi:transcription initiation factor TFIIIB Brf1 subunit/transcription initiation factor TFIIB